MQMLVEIQRLLLGGCADAGKRRKSFPGNKFSKSF